MPYSGAPGIRSVSHRPPAFHPTMRWEHASRTAASQNTPSPQRMWVASATQSRSGPAAAPAAAQERALPALPGQQPLHAFAADPDAIDGAAAAPSMAWPTPSPPERKAAKACGIRAWC
jgi:hypothetical protein